MQKTVRIVALLALSFISLLCLGQSGPNAQEPSSLCSLQANVDEGNHVTVRVSGVFSMGILQDSGCPKETTWVELDLTSRKNWKKLQGILEDSPKREAIVVFDGEFYGPPLPDPKLPENIKKSYHPNWGHLNCCRTKLVVRVIRDVTAVATDHSNDTGQN